MSWTKDDPYSQYLGWQAERAEEAIEDAMLEFRERVMANIPMDPEFWAGKDLEALFVEAEARLRQLLAEHNAKQNEQVQRALMH